MLSFKELRDIDLFLTGSFKMWIWTLGDIDLVDINKAKKFRGNSRERRDLVKKVTLRINSYENTNGEKFKREKSKRISSCLA